jgi:hypothetical protein
VAVVDIKVEREEEEGVVEKASKDKEGKIGEQKEEII